VFSYNHFPGEVDEIYPGLFANGRIYVNHSITKTV